MKKIIKTFAILAAGIFIFHHAKAQDPRFSQFFGNPLKLNPAIMGANTDFRALLGYRNQWGAISNGYTTMSFTAISPVYISKEKGKLDVGLYAMNDAAGAYSTTDFGLAIGYNKEIAPANNLCLSISAGYVQRALKLSGLTYDNQYVNGTYSATNPTGETTLGEKSSYPDVNAGLMWYMNPTRDKSKMNAYFGVSAFHLNQPNQTTMGGKAMLPIRYSMQGGVKIFGDKNIDIAPNARINIQNGNVEAAMGMYIDYVFNDNAKLVVGAWYKRNDAIPFLIGFEHKNFCLAYSYDVVTSRITTVATGLNAHEIILAFKMSRNKAASSKASTDTSGGGDAAEAPSVRRNPISSF